MRVANINLGGRSTKAFEFVSSGDPEWRERYLAMSTILDEDVPESLGKMKWRDLYPRLDTSFDLMVGGNCCAYRGHPNVWYDNDVDSYLRAHKENAVSSGGDAGLFDLMCDAALARAFSSAEEYSEFEKGRVVRDADSWNSKVNTLIGPLTESDVIAVDEAVWLDNYETSLLPYSGRGYTVLHKRDAELVLMYGGNDELIEMTSSNNFYDAEKGTLSEIPPAPWGEPNDKASQTTRRKTIGVETKDYVAFAVHAREHRGTAHRLAQYLSHLCSLRKYKPSVVLIDSNIECDSDAEDFDKALDEFGLKQPSPPWITTFKERTVFQAQQRKAGIPIRARKDRIIVNDLFNFVSSGVVPSEATPAAHGKDATLRLPLTSTWPSDHLAVVANLTLSQTR